jgi:hypothetical protein
MPAPIIYQKGQGLAQGISQFGSALGSAIENYANQRKLQAEQEKQKQQATILAEVLKNADLDSPEGTKALFSELSKAGIQVDPLKMAGLYQNAATQQAKTQESQAKQREKLKLYKSLGIDIDEMEQTQSPQVSQPQQPMTLPKTVIQQPPFMLPQSQPQPPTEPYKTQPSKRFDDKQVQTMLASGDPDLARIAKNEMDVRNQEFQKKQVEQKQFNEERKYHTAQSKPVLDKVFKLRDAVPKKQMALAMARDAVESNEVGALSLNNIAERFNLPELKTAKGAQLVAAGKENLLSNVSRITGQKNKWIEQQIASVFPRIGQSREANLIFSELLEAENALDQAYIDSYDTLSKEDKQQFGYVRDDIGDRIAERIKDTEKKIEDRLTYRTRELYEQEKGVINLRKDINKKPPKGTYLTPLNAKLMLDKFNGDKEKVYDYANKLGYVIPSFEDIQEWQ